MSFDNFGKILSSFEGGYANVEGDRGGETYKGISRVYWPGWEGWRIIDKAKADPLFPKNLTVDFKLQEKVKDFYIENYIKEYGLDRFSDALALELFDQLINRNATQVIRELQTILNALNFRVKNGKEEKIFKDLSIDGILGEKTIAAALSVDAVIIVKALNALQAQHYLITAASNFTQRKFLKGWLTRVG